MTVAYLQLSYEDYKCLEKQMRAFAETTHVSTPGPFYHKSIRLQISPDLIIEFHGPTVRGMQEEEQLGRYPPTPDHPNLCPENMQPCDMGCSGGWCVTLHGSPAVAAAQAGSPGMKS